MVVIINFCVECQLDTKYTNQISAKCKKKRFSTFNILSKYVSLMNFFYYVHVIINDKTKLRSFYYVICLAYILRCKNFY